MSKMIGIEHNGIVRIISLPVSGTDKQISQDEEIMISMDKKIKELEAQLKEALNGTVLKRYNEDKEKALAQLEKAEDILNWIYEMPEVEDASDAARKYFNSKKKT